MAVEEEKGPKWTSSKAARERRKSRKSIIALRRASAIPAGDESSLRGIDEEAAMSPGSAGASGHPSPENVAVAKASGDRRVKLSAKEKGPSSQGGGGAGTKSKFENMLSGVDDYISRWRCGLDDLSSASRATGESRTANSVWQSKEKSKVYSGKGDAIKALLLRNRKAFLKPPDERTSEEVEEVHNLISQTLQTEFFSKYNRSIQKDMAAAMKIEHFKANEVVFVQGDQPGNSGKYYIIAYGRVRIQVEQMAQLDEQEIDKKGADSKSGKDASSKEEGDDSKKKGRERDIHTSQGDKDKEGAKEGDHGGAKEEKGDHDPKAGGEKRPDTSHGGADGDADGAKAGGPQDSPTEKGGISISKITTRRQRRKSLIVASGSQLLTELQTGEGFGELALLSDRARAASAICAEETVLLTLDKSSYLSLMKNEHQKTQQVNLSALSTLRLFKACTRGHIESIAPYFVIQTHNRGTMFNPDKDDHVSFIMKGHAVVAYGVQRQAKQANKDTNSLLSHSLPHAHASLPGEVGPAGKKGLGHMSGAHAIGGDHKAAVMAGVGQVDKLTGLPLKKGKGSAPLGQMMGSMNLPGTKGPGKTTAGHSKREHNLFVIRDLHEGDVFGETCVFQQFQRGYQIHAVTELEVLHISKVQFIDHIDEEVMNHLREETAFRTSYYDGFYALAQKRIEKRAEQLPELRDYLKDRAILYNSVISKSRSVMEEYTSRKNFPLMVDKNGRRIHYSVRSYMIKT